MGDILSLIENLLDFGLSHTLFAEADKIYLRNALYDLLKTDHPGAPCHPSGGGELNETVGSILEPILDYACAANLCEASDTSRDLFAARLMGLFVARPSEIADEFEARRSQSPVMATDWFYQFCRACDYIRADKIALNKYWLAPSEYGEMEITVNLSKPEKNPAEIAASRALPQTNYPKCQLCVENVGFAGNLNHPARQNLRVIPTRLCGEQWFFQYSPYSYYNEHCIVLSEQHTPMLLTEKTFLRLFDFIGQFPHYFLGSNADLPIVGGSILTHDHFQGGRHIFPMEKAASYAAYRHPSFVSAEISLVKWPMSVIRLTSRDNDANRLANLSAHILNKWRVYSDESAGVFAFTDGAPHNTVTPIARYNKDGRLEIDLVLRNNLTTAEHPLGVFHPHANLHHIKKENIGLIEVMGLAVLPGRLDQELGEGTLTRGEINSVFVKVLEDCGVFKTDAAGHEAFHKFMLSCEFSRTI